MPYDLDDIFDIALYDLPQAFGLLWVRLQPGPRYDQAEGKTLANFNTHTGLVNRYYSCLEENRHPRPNQREQAFELAAIDAIDRLLMNSARRDSFEDAPLSLKIGRKRYWMVRRPWGWRPPATRQTRQLQHWCRSHWLIPRRIRGKRTHVLTAPHSVARRMRMAIDAGAIRVLARGFDDDARLVSLPAPPGLLRFSDVHPRQARSASMDKAMDDAQFNGAHVIVFPELTVPPILRERISAMLEAEVPETLCIVVPGSFHEAVGRSVSNRAVVFDGFGVELFEHRKFVRYGMIDDAGPQNAGQGQRPVRSPLLA